MGRRSVRRRSRPRRAGPALGRILGVPLVPRHGARVFEDDEVAASMNAKFVNVKVDREERPDVDSIYMDAVQAITGRGGWPMTVFMTPTGDRSAAAPTSRSETLLKLLDAIDDAWHHRRADLEQNVGGTGRGDRSQRRDGATRHGPTARGRRSRARRRSPRRSTPSGVGSGAHPKFPSDHHPPTGAAGVHDQRRARTRNESSRPRSTRWRPAASTTTSAAGSPGTRSTASGWCRTSRRCSTTKPC